MDNSVKSILEEAGRYKQFMDLLQSISENPALNSGRPMHYNPMLSWVLRKNSITPKYALKATQYLMTAIANEEDIFVAEHHAVEYEELLKYVDTRLKWMFRRYMLSIANRINPDITMGSIRTHLILYTLLTRLTGKVKEPWTIKEGLCKQPDDDDTM